MTDIKQIWRSLRLLLLVALLAAGAVACGGDAGSEEKAKESEEHAEGAEADVVHLDSAALAVAAIQVAPVQSVASSGLQVTGTIAYDPNRVSHIGPRTDGRITALRANIGERVGAGQVLATLESAQVGQIRAEEHEASSLVRIAAENHAREQRLEQQGISSRKELLDAEADLRRAQASLQSARERLRAMGAGPGTGGSFVMTAPFAGVVVARDASLGEMATPADQLFTIGDLSRVWIELDVFERDLGRVSVGQPVQVTVAAYPGQTFPGRIVYIGDVLDPQKRTVPARVEIPNETGALKPGMFANARVDVGAAGGGPAVVVVPQEAVQELEGRKVVFVPGAERGEFRAVAIEVGETLDGNRVVISSGLEPGSTIVVAGAFTLRSELAKGEIGEHGH
jgi:membrane fusion protein, heavy metal efflux system